MKKEPSMLQAADYSAAANYLKAVKAIGTDDTDKVMAYLKKTKINDMFTKNGEDPSRWPHGARHVPDGSEEAVRVEVPMGLLQGRRHHSRATRRTRPRPRPKCALWK